METLFSILDAIYSDDIASFFSNAIICVFLVSTILSFVPILSRWSAGARIVGMTPNLLATLGVLGTFVGILIGLIDFDVTRIDASVPHLLVGLKIAFATSIVGMAASIGFRVLTSFAAKPTSTASVSPADIHHVLVEIRNAIAADGDASLVTQVQKLRTSVQDSNDALIREFRQFAEHMTENNQRAVIEALEVVIRDFNTQLNEQFGENFKQLNEPVGQLVVWQEQYRTQLQELAQRIDLTTQAIERSEAALSAVKSHTEAIPDAIGQLPSAMETLNEQTSRLEADLEAVADLRSKAAEAFPVIEENLNAIGVSLQEMSRETHDNFRAHTERMEQALANELQEALNRLGSSLASLSKKLVDDYDPLTSRLRDIVQIADGVPR